MSDEISAATSQPTYAAGSVGRCRDLAKSADAAATHHSADEATSPETVYSTSSRSSGSPVSPPVKTTGNQVVEFAFGPGRYMVSPHPERGSALALNLQGQSLVIPVATIALVRGQLGEVTWETPFLARSPEWKDAILNQVSQNLAESLLGGAS
ncbi:hypothetical protein [Natronoglycomyces albus]|uniref:Uncharacterized protein n=1 Tax=Natronoglycomyces albus TaxID=2811108 RepID=A0A895XU04_9ACTN|nr:hypothetical protein [Natronoglycomyces albus]QSB05128.1 hypothetical protein JQS30_15425 [Natronoglycomyces albus]